MQINPQNLKALQDFCVPSQLFITSLVLDKYGHQSQRQSSKYLKLEKLKRLRSEDTSRRLMITHTIDSYWIPSQKKTKSKLQI